MYHAVSSRAQISSHAYPALWLTIHMEEKPQAKSYPENNECQTPIMDDPFLLLLLRFDFGR